MTFKTQDVILRENIRLCLLDLQHLEAKIIDMREELNYMENIGNSLTHNSTDILAAERMEVYISLVNTVKKSLRNMCWTLVQFEHSTRGVHSLFK